MASSLDLVNRDPNTINDHLACNFEDVLAEPDGTHSIDCVWKLSYTCFTLWKKFCYIIATTLFGICIAAEWGCDFAYTSFYHIWFFTPCLRLMQMNCGFMKKVYEQCINCCIEPVCVACGMMFHQFRKA